MPDWKEIIRQKLGKLPLTNGRQDEVIEELAQQLESAYEEALAKGAGEEALRSSLAQFPDWEKLRREVFQSVEGTWLPVWEQRGFFAPRRAPVWIALALTLILSALPSFRQSLAMFPFPGWDATAPDERLFSEKFLRKIEQSGDRQKYARTLAYVALHSRNDEQAVHAAEKAIALDPRFTWICARVSHATYLMPGYDPHPWIERLKAWDPQNALPYLLEASASTYGNWETRWSRYNAATPDLRRALAAEPSWRGPMEKAFAAERIDLYESQLFELNRQVLQEQGLDRPDLLMVAGFARPMLDLVAVQSFTDFLVKDVGESAEKAGRPGEALAAYWTVVRFWERLNAGTDYLSRWHIEKARREPYQQLTALLRREGRADEAATIEAALTPFPDDELIRERERAPGESVAKRAARIVLISGVFLVVFAVASLVWMISILILRWSPSFSRSMNRVASVLCFSPAALLLAALTFFLGFYPYAQPMKRFASAHEVTAAYSPFLHSLWISLGYISDIWFSDMFWPSIWCVVVALLGALALRWAAHRKRTDRTGAA